jgi:hypothetical protein
MLCTIVAAPPPHGDEPSAHVLCHATPAADDPSDSDFDEEEAREEEEAARRRGRGRGRAAAAAARATPDSEAEEEDVSEMSDPDFDAGRARCALLSLVLLPCLPHLRVRWALHRQWRGAEVVSPPEALWPLS